MRVGNLLAVFVGLLLAGGAGRLIYLEQTRGPELRHEADAQHTATEVVPALRGEIVDTRGRVLAGSLRRASIYMDPLQVSDAKYAAYTLAPVLNLDPQALLGEIVARSSAPAGTPGREFAWVKREVSDAELDAFRSLAQERGLRGFGVKYERRRLYPYGRAACHVLGFVQGADEQHGLGGIEQSFDRALRGVDGHEEYAVDVRRRRLGASRSSAPPRDGDTVVLTLDVYVQQIAEKYLSETVQYYDGDWGVAVVVYPQSGEVLAMATYPDFDPAEPLPADAEPNTPAFEQAAERLRNRAISDAYEPGSAFKPFVFCSALDDPGVRLSMDEVFPIHGPVHQFGRRTISDTHAYDVLTGSEVISKSSNIGMGMVGDRCGNERLYRYVRNMGFGDLTGIELPGEHTGMVNDFDRWTAYSTQSVPIGQEIAVTALQVATGFSVFCNGGVLYRPRVVRGLVGPDGQIAAEYGMVPVRQALSAETVQKFRLQALVETVKSGTGRITAPLPDYQVFGKTGTAQVAGLKGKGYGLGYTATFVCGAPSDNPRVVVVVSVQHPKQHSYYGGQVSAPAASRILGDTLRYLKVPAELAPAPPRTPPTRRR